MSEIRQTRSIVQQVESTVINEHGELIEQSSSTVFNVGAEPDYIKLYLEDILYLNDLQANQSSLLYQLLSYMTYGNEIILNSTIKKRIAEKLGTSMQVIDNNLSKYVKANILERVGRGTYLANPYLFGKGSWKDISAKRNANIHLDIKYSSKNEKGREIKVSFEENKAELRAVK